MGASVLVRYGKDLPRPCGALWLNLPALDRQEFDAYFQGQTVAYALEVTNVWEYQSPGGSQLVER